MDCRYCYSGRVVIISCKYKYNFTIEPVVLSINFNNLLSPLLRWMRSSLFRDKITAKIIKKAST